jgi:hypothetical protein
MGFVFPSVNGHNKRMLDDDGDSDDEGPSMVGVNPFYGPFTWKWDFEREGPLSKSALEVMQGLMLATIAANGRVSSFAYSCSMSL